MACAFPCTVPCTAPATVPSTVPCTVPCPVPCAVALMVALFGLDANLGEAEADVVVEDMDESVAEDEEAPSLGFDVVVDGAPTSASSVKLSLFSSG